MDGHSPLYSLLAHHDEFCTNTILPRILKGDTDPNLGTKIPIIAAALHCRLYAIQMLLKAGADVDKSEYSNKDTALTTVLAVCCERRPGRKTHFEVNHLEQFYLV